MWTGIDVRLLTASIVALEEITVANDIEDVVDDGGAPADPALCENSAEARIA